MTKFIRTYKFVTEIQMGKLYEDMPIVGYEHYVDIPMEDRRTFTFHHTFSDEFWTTSQGVKYLFFS